MVAQTETGIESPVRTERTSNNMRQLLREALLGPLLILLTVVFVALFADVLAPHNPEVSVKSESGRPVRSYLPPFWMQGGSLNTPLGTVREIYNRPRHPYTEGLLKSVPKIGSKEALYAIPGQPPNLANLPAGCAFAPRCASAVARCRTEAPKDITFADGHLSKCWLWEPEGVRD